MIVTRGLGRPGGLLVSGALGRILTTANGATYVLSPTGWLLVTDMYIYTAGAWVLAPTVSIRKDGAWVQVWPAP